MSGRARSLVERLLATLGAECPAAVRAAAAAAAGMTIEARVGDETLAIAVDGEAPRLLDGVAAPTVRVATSLATVRALVVGERELASALFADDLAVFAGAAELVRLDELVRLLVAGAARSPGAEPLLDELLEVGPG